MRVNELTDFVVSLVASAMFLSLAVLAASRGKRDPLARLLAVLCVDLVSYGTSEAIGVLTPQRLWDWINETSASLAPALFYHLVIAFVGRRIALRRTLFASYMYFGTL